MGKTGQNHLDGSLNKRGVAVFCAGRANTGESDKDKGTGSVMYLVRTCF